MTFRTEQEAFWAGQFGSEYIGRNDSNALLASNLNFFSTALRRAGRIGSCTEFGANVGMNLRALQLLFPGIDLNAIEINGDAARILRSAIDENRVFCGSIFDYSAASQADLSLIKGVLIHIKPEMLAAAYQKLYETSRRWILLCEYYNPSPVAIAYRGHTDRLFKRDFAGEMMEQYSDLQLRDYGFVYRRDPAFPQDDITWFLMEKGS